MNFPSPENTPVLPSTLMDNEVYGITGSWYDYGERPYMSLLIRFPKPDPRYREFPFMSPYTFAANNPIRFIDADGKGPEDPPIYQIGAEKIISNFAIQKSSSGSFTQSALKNISSFEIQNRTLFSKSSAVGLTSKADNAFGLGGGMADELTVLNQGATQIAFAEQQVTVKGLEGFPNLAVVEIINITTLVNLEGGEVGLIQTTTQKVTQSLLLSQVENQKEFKGVSDVVGETSSSTTTNIVQSQLSKEQQDYVSETANRNVEVSKANKAIKISNQIKDAINAKEEKVIKQKYKENKQTMIRE